MNCSAMSEKYTDECYIDCYLCWTSTLLRTLLAMIKKQASGYLLEAVPTKGEL
jgi:hypothetical protein